MEYDKKLTKNFIKRTKSIIHQYEDFSSENKERYEVTLKINCLFGLLIIPKTAYYSEFRSSITVKDGSKYYIEINNKQVETCDSKILFHCLRNALAHWLEKGNKNLQFENENGEISRTTIEGSGKVNNNSEKVIVVKPLVPVT